MSRNMRNYRRKNSVSRAVMTRNMTFDRYLLWWEETHPNKPLSLRYTVWGRYDV